MWSTENSRFCEKYIEKQPKTSQNGLFSAVFWSKWQDSNLRSHRPERCAIPPSLHLDVVKIFDFFCKWSNMWSDRRFNDFSTFGRTEKVSVFKGFRIFSKFIRRERWLSPETGAIPPSLRLDNRENSHLGACSQGRIRWLLREPSSLTKKHTVPPQMRWSSLGVNCFYWILLWLVMWSKPLFDRSCTEELTFNRFLWIG